MLDKLGEKVTIIKISVAIIVAITGILTVIFSILNMAHVYSSSPNVVLRILVGVLLVILGVSTSIIAIFSNRPLKFITAILCASIIGIGIFMFLPGANNVITTLVFIAFPIIIACFGSIKFLKAIVDGVTHANRRFVLNIIIGAGLVALGVCFAVFNKNEILQDLVWLFLGLAIVIGSIVEIALFIKESHRKTPLDAQAN